MTENKILENFKRSNIFIPLIIVVISCSSLIIINYLTIKILSASRAYVNGESHYSKGQKDATRHLITYLFTNDTSQWKLFNDELSVPKGDKTARIGLVNNTDIEIVKDGFRAGRNDERDLDDLIWLFKHFYSVSFLAKAINEWEKGDQLIDQLALIGNQAHKKISTNTLSTDEKEKIFQQINSLTQNLTINQRNFSDSLGEGTRLIKSYLLYTNIFFTFIIIGSVSIYYSLMIKKLRSSKQETEDKNRNLIIVNKELDKFVYSASHDLRSPISSLKGLIEIVKLEDDLDEIRDYLDLMHQSLDKQDQFIRDIIDYSRNKRKKVTTASVSINEIIDEIISQHFYIKGTSEITIKKNLSVDEVQSDGLRLKIILNNLLSNAIKYSDEKKETRYISIKTYTKGEFYQIEIEDNGIGINKEYLVKIFEMFFVTNNSKRGSGLGLYLVKEAVENLNGNITVDSKMNIGSKFIVTIPIKHEGQL
ncbi:MULTISPECIES: sensor histidine kinase [Flavobacterium]|uniref:histidine kinase n=1 Tax=Flavobacterium algoritolerans TaxID=3041254 RepID=A0ABT6VAR3_9FLAO|nr:MULTISPECIES: HAMP domain-containing sensor histidine kinase [Flavobacterium]MDI5888973.1 HAMP domain-containing sensor histidine kinase [Flavobacterium yafengii]MDI5895333.1 HAMP domain-containing sensor histidine kinase [Flavobacterium algoritolerans]